MILLKKSALRRMGIAALIAILLGVIVVGVTLAAGSASILTAPMQVDAKVYQDANNNGLNDPEEFVGTFDVYDGMKTISIKWNAATFPAGATGSYRVSMWQNTTPLGTATWKEITFGHHWASNPNGTTFTVGPFGPGKVCTTCPTMFKVQPETYLQSYNTETQTYEYVYTALPSALTLPAALEQSEEFVLNVVDYSAPPAQKQNSESCGQPCDPSIGLNCAAGFFCDSGICDNNSTCKLGYCGDGSCPIWEFNAGDCTLDCANN